MFRYSLFTIICNPVIFMHYIIKYHILSSSNSHLTTDDALRNKIFFQLQQSSQRSSHKDDVLLFCGNICGSSQIVTGSLHTVPSLVKKICLFYGTHLGAVNQSCVKSTTHLLTVHTRSSVRLAVDAHKPNACERDVRGSLNQLTTNEIPLRVAI